VYKGAVFFIDLLGFGALTQGKFGLKITKIKESGSSLYLEILLQIKK
jgi:hypothetical protein